MVSGLLLLALAAALAIPAVVLWRRVFAGAAIPHELRVPGAASVDTAECRLAVHEAGHAVAAWCCTLVSEVTIATIEAKDRGAGWDGGFVNYTYYRTYWSSGDWCKMVIALAGVAAEALVYSRWRSTGSERDLLQALEIAEGLVAKGAAEHIPWQRLGETPGRAPDLGKAFKTRPPAAVAENLNEGYRMARHVLGSHGGAFFKVVSMLLAKKSTTRADMEQVLGKRHFEQLVALGAQLESVVNESGKPEHFKPRFVLPLRRRKAA
jgi:ATP-dependent Zn protease